LEQDKISNKLYKTYQIFETVSPQRETIDDNEYSENICRIIKMRKLEEKGVHKLDEAGKVVVEVIGKIWN
jgi:hypothetical protein